MVVRCFSCAAWTKELSAAVSNRQILDSQLKENEVVLQVARGLGGLSALVGAAAAQGRQQRVQAGGRRAAEPGARRGPLQCVQARRVYQERTVRDRPRRAQCPDLGRKRVEVSLKGAQAKMESKQNEVLAPRAGCLPRKTADQPAKRIPIEHFRPRSIKTNPNPKVGANPLAQTPNIAP